MHCLKSFLIVGEKTKKQSFEKFLMGNLPFFQNKTLCLLGWVKCES